ncbi:hypothetical protein KY313_03310 [Candidatus Woesearchaeota archaeon]|jgi:hypothetical protein|nr:hypothetical protein [Candidatus Woesearchaeota archaeon]
MTLFIFGEDLIVSEGIDFNVEKDRSSEIFLYPEEGKIVKDKNRTRKKTIYEAFMMDLWSNIFKEYNKAQDMRFNAPVSRGITFKNTDLTTYLLMDFCKGVPIKKLRNLGERKTRFNGKDISLSSLVMYHLGGLQAIKEHEGLFHSDYDQRHVFFYQDKFGSRKPQLSVIDVENSRLRSNNLDLGSLINNPVISENEGFYELITTMFPGHEEKDFYEIGYEKMPSLGVADSLVDKTRKAFDKKFLKPNLPKIVIDPYNQTVNYI